jgi:hypothetical protein
MSPLLQQDWTVSMLLKLMCPRFWGPIKVQFKSINESKLQRIISYDTKLRHNGPLKPGAYHPQLHWNCPVLLKQRRPLRRTWKESTTCSSEIDHHTVRWRLPSIPVPVMIRIKIGPQQPLARRKRRLNGDLWGSRLEQILHMFMCVVRGDWMGGPSDKTGKIEVPDKDLSLLKDHKHRT